MGSFGCGKKIQFSKNVIQLDALGFNAKSCVTFFEVISFMFTVYPKELGCIAYLRVTVCVCDSVRGKTLQLLDSNPVQFLLCVLVLIDAAVVVAEILIDLHAVKSTSSAS